MLSYRLSKFNKSDCWHVVAYAKIISKGKDANGSKNEEMCTRTQRINSNVFVLQTQIMNESKFERFRVYCICACWNIVWILNNNITFDIQPGDDIPLSLSPSRKILSSTFVHETNAMYLCAYVRGVVKRQCKRYRLEKVLYCIPADSPDIVKQK